MLKYIFSPRRLEKVRNNKVIPYLYGNILELWCGLWSIANYLNTQGVKNNYTGVDFNKKIIDALSTNFPSLKFIQHDLDELLYLENITFDTVVSIAVIEHIYNQKKFLLTATRNLKMGWRLIITTPSNFWNDLIYPIICKLGMREGKWVLTDHITIYNRDRFLVAANDFGLELEHFEHFEFFCNQLAVFKKIKIIE